MRSHPLKRPDICGNYHGKQAIVNFVIRLQEKNSVNDKNLDAKTKIT